MASKTNSFKNCFKITMNAERLECVPTGSVSTWTDPSNANAKKDMSFLLQVIHAQVINNYKKEIVFKIIVIINCIFRCG